MDPETSTCELRVALHSRTCCTLITGQSWYDSSATSAMGLFGIVEYSDTTGLISNKRSLESDVATATNTLLPRLSPHVSALPLPAVLMLTSTLRSSLLLPCLSVSAVLLLTSTGRSSYRILPTCLLSLDAFTLATVVCRRFEMLESASLRVAMPVSSTAVRTAYLLLPSPYLHTSSYLRTSSYLHMSSCLHTSSCLSAIPTWHASSCFRE